MSKIKKIVKAVKKPLEKIQKKIDAHNIKYGEGSSREIVEGAVALSIAGTGTVLGNKKRKEANKKRKETKKKYTPSNREAKKGFGIEKK